MVGAIIGDVVGSRFEFSNHLDKKFDFFHRDCHYTDDTVMTCAVAESILRCKGDYTKLYDTANETLREVGRPFPYCGYGGMFWQWMYKQILGPYNSFGNGSAMRVSAVGFAADSIEQAKEMSHAVTAITHNHPEGLKGAEATAVAIVLARQGKSKEEILDHITEHYYALDKTCDEYREMSGGMHGQEICQVSLPQAFTCFKESTDFEDCIRNCISIGGDSDTLGAIAGGIAEAYYGVPEEYVMEVRKYVPGSLMEIADRFRAAYNGS